MNSGNGDACIDKTKAATGLSKMPMSITWQPDQFLESKETFMSALSWLAVWVKIKHKMHFHL